MNIEKLAIEKMIYEHTGFNPNVADDAETIKNIKNLLEAFAKALQSSEPVYQICFDGNGAWFDVPSCEYERETVYEKRILFTHPPASVSLEKYNKLLEVLKAVENDRLQLPRMKSQSLVSNRVLDEIKQAIAEAEGKEG